MNRRIVMTVAVLLVVAAGSLTDAQQRGRGRGGFGGFGGGFGGFGRTPDLLTLASVEGVQKEIEALDDQVADINKIREEMRPQRGQGRQRGQGAQRGRRGGGGGGDGQQAQGNRGRRGGDRGEPTEEQRQEFRRRAEERAKQAEERAKEIEVKLAGCLLPHQMDRLKEIHLQRQGTGALRSNSDVVAKLKITPEQTAKMEELQRTSGEAIREQMQALGDTEDRTARFQKMRELMEESRKQTDTKLLAVLTGTQKTEFTAMKGKHFEMPQNAFGFGGGRGRGVGGTGRPERAQRPGTGN